ncbi:MAG: OsmC family protein [Nitriliruptoraceae bacterium]
MTASCTNLDLDAFDATRRAVAEDPSQGTGSFATVTRWEDGARARTTARSFAIETDEPAPLGGTDAAVDPMELLLAALGTCLTIGWVTQAAKRGLDYRDLRIEVIGTFDLRGYLALDEAVRPGFDTITYRVDVDTDATSQQLEEIRLAAEATSPMFDNIRSATPIAAQIEVAAA